MSKTSGTLFLMPNSLDLGCPEKDLPPLEHSLPSTVIAQASTLAHWVAENAKTTRAFLKRVNTLHPLHTPLQSISIVELPRPMKGQHSSTSQRTIDWMPWLKPLLDGQDLGLISEAGLPAVADPGAGLVQAAHLADIKVHALSGPSSLMLALAASGLQGQCFAFVGYLPTDSALRSSRLRELEAISKRLQQTQIVIETPYRNPAVWAALLSSLNGNTLVSISCGLTLPGGFSMTRTVAQWHKQPPQLPTDTPAVFCFLATS